MKKNKMMRLASVLLVAVLMSTCAISGTFAKYVTNGTATSTARVAKFGVKVNATGNLFSTTYAVDEEKTKIEGNSVISSTAENVVAPGTSGSLTNIQITGMPEVAVRVTNEATVTLNDKWVVGDEFYCPIIIKVNDTTIDGKTCRDAADFQTRVENAIKATTAEYPANTNFNQVSNEGNVTGLSVSWEWPFVIKGEDGTVDAEIDRKDTALGDAAAGVDGGVAGTISISVTTTVTQID